MPKNPQKYYILSIATKSTLTIKNEVHLTIDIKFNVYFMRKNSFMKNLTTFQAKLKNCVPFNFSHRFDLNYKLENAIIFNFSGSIWPESFHCSKQTLRN